MSSYTACSVGGAANDSFNCIDINTAHDRGVRLRWEGARQEEVRLTLKWNEVKVGALHNHGNGFRLTLVVEVGAKEGSEIGG